MFASQFVFRSLFFFQVALCLTKGTLAHPVNPKSSCEEPNSTELDQQLFDFSRAMRHHQSYYNAPGKHARI